jgi:hypothetical protein
MAFTPLTFITAARAIPAALLFVTCGAMEIARAQSRVSCEAYARDYANMIAPRSGAPLVGGFVQGLPNPAVAGRDARSARTAPSDTGRMGADLGAQRNAYAAALARCRAGR